jgi:uncharacterized protein with von Willebrand factor type A (vWA) domain
MTGAPAQGEQPQASQRVLDALFQGAEKIEREKQEIELDARFTVSDREVLEQKDFAQMSASRSPRPRTPSSAWCWASTRSNRAG